MQAFPYESLLQTLAELGVAFIGFSMLASVFRGSRGDGLLRLMDFRDVAEIGLIATVGSLAPQLLYAFDLSEELAWRLAGGLLGGLYLLGYTAAIRRRPVSHSSLFARAPVSQVVVTGSMIAIAVLSSMNLLFPSAHSGARHVLAIVLTLVVAALLFMRAAFTPELERAATQPTGPPDAD